MKLILFFILLILGCFTLECFAVDESNDGDLSPEKIAELVKQLPSSYVTAPIPMYTFTDGVSNTNTKDMRRRPSLNIKRELTSFHLKPSESEESRKLPYFWFHPKSYGKDRTVYWR
jgi:hypothetical protein